MAQLAAMGTLLCSGYTSEDKKTPLIRRSVNEIEASGENQSADVELVR